MKEILIFKNHETLSQEEIISEVLTPTQLESFEPVFFAPQKEKNKIKTEYSVTQIKEISRKISLKSSHMYKNPIYIISQGDKLTPISQNSFLKTLEDSNSSILILVNNIASLLPTIISRCQVRSLSLEETPHEENQQTISIQNIKELSKRSREEVISLLEDLMQNTSTPQRVLALQNGITQLKSNCKVEAVLLELIDY